VQKDDAMRQLAQQFDAVLTQVINGARDPATMAAVARLGGALSAGGGPLRSSALAMGWCFDAWGVLILIVRLLTPLSRPTPTAWQSYLPIAIMTLVDLQSLCRSSKFVEDEETAASAVSPSTPASTAQARVTRHVVLRKVRGQLLAHFVVMCGAFSSPRGHV
jgi:hypothetical protein